MVVEHKRTKNLQSYFLMKNLEINIKFRLSKKVVRISIKWK